GKDLVVSPDAESFRGALRVAEIAGSGEELARGVESPSREEFLRADDPEEIALFGADEVLASAAARQREVGGRDVAVVRQVGEQAGVLVVGVGGDVQNPAGVA